MTKKKKIVFSLSSIVIILLLIIGWSQISYMIGVLNRTNNNEYKELYSETASKFDVFTYNDDDTGLSIQYNLFVPDNYSGDNDYPLLTFIGDSSTIGTNVEKPLNSGIGGLIWASDSEQNKHESFVLIPQYPEVIIDDHDGYTTTKYIDATKRLIDSLSTTYSIDTNRIYGTGQSMGCMTTLVLSTSYPDLYAAELFIDGQWDITQMNNIDSQKFIYIAAAGDDRALTGQNEVKKLLKDSGISYNEISDINARESSSELTSSLANFLAKNNNYNFITFKKGTVLPWYVPSTVSEHMFSFDYGYNLEAVRDWIYQQSKD